MKIALVQFNPLIGNIKGNSYNILQFYKTAKNNGAECVIFPEMALIGYPPLDLLFHSSIRQDVHESINELIESSTVPLIFGSPLYLPTSQNPDLTDIFSINDFWIKEGGIKEETSNYNNEDVSIYNSAMVSANGKLIKIVTKSLLPNYDVFDEKRYFTPGGQKQDRIVKIDKLSVGLSICEDLWFDHPRELLCL